MNIFKSTIYGLAALAAVGTLTACGDSYLDTKSKTEASTESFDDAESMLVGCYNGWKRTVTSPGKGLYLALEMMSDDCYAGTGVSDAPDYCVVDRFDQGQYTAGTDLFRDLWKAYYRCIGRCNTLLSMDESGQFTYPTDADHERVLGECRAIRALCYLDMVRFWENVPLMMSVKDEVNQPQANPDDVWAAVFDDLKYAAQAIPANAYPKSAMAANDGRITRYAAEAMLARAYLFYTGYYGKEHPSLTKAEAVAFLDEVIASNEYALVSNFADLWPAASSVSMPDSHAWDPAQTTYAELNSEVVLQMKFNYTDDRYNNSEEANGNPFIVMMGLRKVYASPYAYGWGACPVNKATFRAFANNDPRRAHSIIDMEGEGLMSGKTFDPTTYLKDQREYTGYNVKKYIPTCYYDGETSVPEQTGSGAIQEYQPQPWILMRYADVLLMAAELGGVPTMNAQSALDAVRSRAGLGSVPATKENILNERHYELAFEGVRYWDLLRQGVDYAANVIAQNTTVKTGNTDVNYSITANNITSKRGFAQIPQTEINLSGGVLKQNAGW